MGFFNKPIGQIPPARKEEKTNDSDCKIRYKRDKTGKVREISFEGNCTRTQVEIAKQQLDLKGEEIN